MKRFALGFFLFVAGAYAGTWFAEFVIRLGERRVSKIVNLEVEHLEEAIPVP